MSKHNEIVSTHVITSERGGVADQVIELQDDEYENVRFRGRLVCQVSSHTKQNQQRWTELHGYRTSAGQYVVHELGYSRIPGETTRRAVHVGSDYESLREHVGPGRLAIDLYRKLGLSPVREIR